MLIEQIRLPAIETSQTPWLLEAVAGMIETDETAEQVVRREADEEAGLVIGRTEKALSYLSSPGAPLNVCMCMLVRLTVPMLLVSMV